jgi:hypothetical protein
VNLSGIPLLGRPLALSANTKGCKGLTGANTLAYFKNSLITDVKSFMAFGPGAFIIFIENTVE